MVAARSLQRPTPVESSPANEVVLGELTLACTECTRGQVEQAVRAVAARLGARTVVGPDCHRFGAKGGTCRAELTVLELENVL